MPQLLNLTTIKKWIRDYRRNKQLPNETNSVTIDLEKIKEFISYIDEQNAKNGLTNQSQQGQQNQINAVRFYFTRQNNIADVNVAKDGTDSINDNLNDTNKKLKVRQQRMPVFYDNLFTPQTQISLLALPVLNYQCHARPDNDYTKLLDDFRQHGEPDGYHWWVGEDYKPEPDEIHCLYARNKISEHSGLCPYNCDGTEDGEE